MYQDFFKQTNVDFDRFVAPVRKFNALVVDHAEKLAQFQLEAAQSYTSLSLENLRSALEIKQPQDLQQYVGRQQAVAETVGKKLSDDANALAGLNKGFVEQMQKLAQENATSLNGSSKAPAKKAPARKSA